MKTRALVAMIMRESPDFSSIQIIEYLNEVQNILLRRRIPLIQLLDETTGESPVVFVDSSITTKYVIKDAWFIGDVTDKYGNNVRCRIFPASETSDAYFIISDYTGEVIVEAYKKPQQITSVNIELTVPPEYHLNVVKEGVLAYLEQAEYGNSQRMEKFERVLIPRFIGGISHVITNDSEYFRESYS